MRLADPQYGLGSVTHRRQEELNDNDYLYQEDGSGDSSLSGLDSESEKTPPRPRKRRQ